MSSDKSFEIDVKRFYMPGHELADTCAECGNVVTYGLGDNYLSYPMANKPTGFYFSCGECGHEWKRKILVTVEVKLLSEGNQPQEAT